MEGKLAVPLEVENVQALASKNLESIPTRYIRPELELEFDFIKEAEASGIPVIDLRKLTRDGDDNKDELLVYEEEMRKLHLACQEWGFFQLVNHGVAEDVMEKVIEDVSEFFKLPFESKKACSQDSDRMEGYGQSFVFSEAQKLDWGDMLYISTQPLDSRKMRFWPTHPLTFRETVNKYSSELEKIKIKLLGLMAKNLGIGEENFTNMFNGGIQSMRMNYYPPCPEASKVLGISPHSDATSITILLQLNQVQGLQIRHHGHWVPVKLLPDALLVNIGDTLEILSNGIYKSIEHRVVIDKEKERLSVAAFHDTIRSATIEPLPELINGETEQKYKSISALELSKLLTNSKLHGKGLLDQLVLK